MFACLSVIYESLDIESSFLVCGDLFTYKNHRVKVKVTEAENAKFPIRNVKPQSAMIPVFSERELMFTFAICRRPSVCLSSVCNVGAPYSAD